MLILCPARKPQNLELQILQKIVFWAGSDNITNTSIQQAAFQVTENGSIYASQGLFEGAIITQSIIQGARIYTSSLYGGTEGQEAALKIYDTTKGIQFFERQGIQ